VSTGDGERRAHVGLGVIRIAWDNGG
jgi:hypothetical protein